MDFQKKLETYATLLIEYGLNVQQGQLVNITGEVFHRDLITLLCQAAYKRGAKYVNVDFIDPVHTRSRIQNTASKDFLSYVPAYIPSKFDCFVEENAAVLRLIGSEEPDSLADLNPDSINNVQGSIRAALKNYYVEGVGKSKVHWTVAAASTPKWGQKLFPELDDYAAYMALWELIFKTCRADKPNCIELWKEHNKVLSSRARHLTELKIKELHFTGPETDLKVYLTPKARFKGGCSKGPHGVEFEANIPTEECFTTPDRRFTTGKVKVTRPVLVNGKLVKNLRLEFKEGKLVHFTADEGEDNFRKYVDNDAGARFLGEVALVGTDSPIYESGKVFEEILFDENAACHIAFGFAYLSCLDGGPSMSSQELIDHGCNTSNVHIDVMISDAEVNVDAVTHTGDHIKLIHQGKWIQ